MELEFHEQGLDSLTLFDLQDGKMVRPRAIFEPGCHTCTLYPHEYNDAVSQGVPRGQALALALGQPKGTVVNGPVTVIDQILHIIHKVTKEET